MKLAFLKRSFIRKLNDLLLRVILENINMKLSIPEQLFETGFTKEQNKGVDHNMLADPLKSRAVLRTTIIIINCICW